jgi:PemK-like, MazF-like toxin of type II toxin-antitoxin system
MVSQYIPARGDIVKLNFDPTLGREQAGYRPALIVTTIEGSSELLVKVDDRSRGEVSPIENSGEKRRL